MPLVSFLMPDRGKSDRGRTGGFTPPESPRAGAMRGPSGSFLESGGQGGEEEKGEISLSHMSIAQKLIVIFWFYRIQGLLHRPFDDFVWDKVLSPQGEEFNASLRGHPLQCSTGRCSLRVVEYFFLEGKRGRVARGEAQRKGV